MNHYPVIASQLERCKLKQGQCWCLRPTRVCSLKPWKKLWHGGEAFSAFSWPVSTTYSACGVLTEAEAHEGQCLTSCLHLLLSFFEWKDLDSTGEDITECNSCSVTVLLLLLMMGVLMETVVLMVTTVVGRITVMVVVTLGTGLLCLSPFIHWTPNGIDVMALRREKNLGGDCTMKPSWIRLITLKQRR